MTYVMLLFQSQNGLILIGFKNKSILSE